MVGSSCIFGYNSFIDKVWVRVSGRVATTADDVGIVKPDEGSLETGPTLADSALIQTRFKVSSRPIVVETSSSEPKVRHNKGVRQRGCPCCDPDNMENIVDRLLFLNAPL